MAYTGIPLSMNAGSQPERIFGLIVSGNYFDVLGTRPALGRFFAPEEDQTPNTHPVAVLSYGMWRQRFGGDETLVGKPITLNGNNLRYWHRARRLQGYVGGWRRRLGLDDEAKRDRRQLLMAKNRAG